MTTETTFASLDLAPEILRAVEEQGYTKPTPIQAQAIPMVLDGRDLMAGAQTGTGNCSRTRTPAHRPPAIPYAP